ncbi:MULTISPECIES: sigma-70 family RNA polymerase sigma factor [Paraburkholderia]|uniref:Sigma-70 family RNA polymerase sigma factor n=1 Tax=Paraburkholderia madseniana TaxID=2599607 RepID=A0AAP5BDS0_9BURK|nr:MULTISPECIES: sigma-70 family RNA polymerase sigma factor [Paraburkholderia]MCX4146729.1 sigma-70 family RNA polymerase sigma factor [Paraburkholderia madseniana]MDN7149675.1 sigma-70 family RNA polymerase sigma factor [Paraburkholderia sp. WS6]MDQ6408555.1 sigma-70 family RNA polymerase sigma factor [Paraburkholderia madseniana]
MTEQGIDKASSFEAVRARLLALAYRMLGSRAEAEDVVQDVWLKWHLADTQEVQTPAAWLTTITTRAAIDRLRHVQRERASQTAGWLPEPRLDEVAPSAEELALRAAEMSYGVMLLLERLKPDERAAFVLHEAFDCDYAEIAKILDRTPASCRQIVHRAKGRLQRAGAPLERPDPAAHARIVERLRTALEAQDRAGLLRLFSDAPEVVSDAPVCTQELAPVAWMETVTALAHQASHAEVVSVEGAMCIALLFEGEVVGVIDVSTQSLADGSTKIVALRAVTSAARLQAANRLLGRAAVMKLLARIQRHALTSITMRGDFPINVDA